MGNEFAYIVMFTWPLIAIYLFKTKTIQLAILWTILGGFMFLPVRTEVDLPFIPPFGKHSIPVISAMIGCWFIARSPVKYFKYTSGWLRVLTASIFIAPVFTVLTNRDAIVLPALYLPGLTNHDALSTIVNQILLVTPFFMGRQFFRTYENQLLMFKTLVIAGLFYSILMLIEIRLSPQLHTWIYGYFPHSFGQMKRFGGFRPVVFMGHGLLTAYFTVIVLICAAALWQSGEKIKRFSPLIMTFYFVVVLILCKSLAAMMYGLFALVIIKTIKSKTQIRFAIILVLLTIFYPTMSTMKWFPHQTVLNIASSVSEQRSASLAYRFRHEDILAEHGRDKPLFGWGGWGRSRIYNDETGDDISTTDGRWIITVGQFGWVGFFTEFGLLGITVFRARKAAKLLSSKPEQTLLAAHAVLVSIIMIDQLPNASLNPWLWLLAGILLGRSEYIISENKVKPIPNNTIDR